jgi:hypothetical protein
MNQRGTNSPGETTAVYTRLKEILQERADKDGLPFTYQFSTDNPRMMAWAQNAGVEVFGWRPFPFQEGIAAEVEIYPSNQQPE